MNIIIAGGTGFIGQAMVKRYLAQGHTVSIIGRSKEKTHALFSHTVKFINWSELPSIGDDIVQKAQVIINLAGANIAAKRWTEKRKQELLNSRTYPTQKIATLCAQLGPASPPLLNAGGVGIYGHQVPLVNQLPPVLDERIALNTDTPSDFLAELGHQWEAATQVAKNAQVRVVNMRFGIVLDRNGGALPRMLLPFRFYLGGPMGSGQQPFPWIALNDLVKAVDFLIAHPNIRGPVNLVAPQGITQKQFIKAIGQALNKPSSLPMPEFAIKLLFGQMGKELLLSGQHVAPHVLLDAGFLFQYPTIESALTTILGKKS
ncbi:MAG: TIGR01777 family oxidoreductase [Gammaproteobacteria bacterium]